MRYICSWTLKDSTKVKNQIYTAESIPRLLENLEEWKATDINIVSEDSVKPDSRLQNLADRFYDIETDNFGLIYDFEKDRVQADDIKTDFTTLSGCLYAIEELMDIIE